MSSSPLTELSSTPLPEPPKTEVIPDSDPPNLLDAKEDSAHASRMVGALWSGGEEDDLIEEWGCGPVRKKYKKGTGAMAGSSEEGGGGKVTRSLRKGGGNARGSSEGKLKIPAQSQSTSQNLLTPRQPLKKSQSLDTVTSTQCGLGEVAGSDDLGDLDLPPQFVLEKVVVPPSDEPGSKVWWDRNVRVGQAAARL